MAGETAQEWDAATVRTWLGSRIAAARSEQVVAQRGGRSAQDDCDKAAAEEMVCSLVRTDKATADAEAFLAALRALLEREDYIWRGVYDDRRFDRHVRAFIKKLVRMAKANEGFGNVAHYQ